MQTNQFKSAQMAANYNNFRLLLILRIIAVNLYAFALLISYYIFDVMMPIHLLFGELTILAFFALSSFLRLRKADEIEENEVFVWLLIDIVFLWLVLSQSGGPSNPFVAVFLIPVTLGAVMFERARAWGVFTAIMFGLIALEAIESPYFVGARRHTGFFNLNTQGMMLSYFITAAILVYFVNETARNLKEKEAAIFALKRGEEEEKEIMRMGIMAAGAAHELGTPLSTISVILHDWLDLSPPKAKAARDGEIRTMIGEIERCKNSLSQILAKSGNSRGLGAAKTDLHSFMRKLIADFQSGKECEIESVINAKNFDCVIDETMAQSIINILDNANKANRVTNDRRIIILIHQIKDNIEIAIEDFGSGFKENAAPKDFAIETSEQGFGVGLMLARNVFRKLGGGLNIENKDSGGAIVRAIFPKNSIQV